MTLNDYNAPPYAM